jgi:hypothetical protein
VGQQTQPESNEFFRVMNPLPKRRFYGRIARDSWRSLRTAVKTVELLLLLGFSFRRRIEFTAR